ncbi:NirD/YgiW/YdeI family stress tolerance protein [Shewanella submarina]|uniref:NirD/YgiW/YdeI family stress tolerance protein n=1 Tax=Shewanella submarina TaxID=2016376 RepID=A0ABV7GCW0_9GAMM|nr:NirD/YgiW/YdeI family stress tolerance protein [Shewanella submarina]MCL1039547.1 NirD/YgiW/YdeI family stress tolerance protein [Shewanella submarina]
MSNKAAAILLMASLVSASAMAAYTGPGVDAQITTASAVKDAKDGAKTQLTGKIIKSLGDEKYQFQDESGVVVIEIDDDLLRNIHIDENTPVVLVGEVDSDWNGQEVEIDVINLLNDTPATETVADHK